MTEGCLAFARLTGRKVTMKGLDPNEAGSALMAEALVLIYGIELDARAFDLVKHLNSYVVEILQNQTIDDCRTSGGSEGDLAILRNVATAWRANTTLSPVFRELADKAVKRAGLMGAKPLPPRYGDGNR